MFIMLKLCNFGTIYLWLFVMKALQVCTGQRMVDTRGGGAGLDNLLMKPLPYQLLDYMADLLKKERSSNTLWQTPAKDKQHPADFERLHFAIQPKTGSGFEEGGGGDGDAGHAMASSEITFENLNDFDILNAIWPPPPKYNENGQMVFFQPQQQQLQQLRHRFPLPPVLALPANALYKKGFAKENRPYSKYKRAHTSWLSELRKVGNDANIGNDDNDESRGDNDSDDGDSNDSDDENSKSSGLPLKDDDMIITNDNTVISYSNTGKGNENSNYSDNNEVMRGNNDSTASANNDDNKNVENAWVATNKDVKKRAGRVRKKKPKTDMMTPYVPAISAGAMTNLGKFFRDLSKNVQFSEKYQWSSEDQKLLEGDPTFGNLHHHLVEPHVTGDHAGEWIKAIRFYRPSQKIRSLVAMNPHGQWAHGSHFIDPNYMWMGLGK